jgi:aminoglycoside phosphotransferase (APT) family kinase protein
VLLHGDLLGQNVHLGLGEAHGLLDWERAEIGDPAHDFAIITRGVRQPYKQPNALDRMLEAYDAAGGRPLKRTRVQFFELALLAHQLEGAIAERGDVEGSENRVLSLLKRLAT